MRWNNKRGGDQLDFKSATKQHLRVLPLVLLKSDVSYRIASTSVHMITLSRAPSSNDATSERAKGVPASRARGDLALPLQKPFAPPQRVRPALARQRVHPQQSHHARWKEATHLGPLPFQHHPSSGCSCHYRIRRRVAPVPPLPDRPGGRRGGSCS
jgi:hypothetical protein